ncbi:hypothetical protein sos41_17940 [Alphaproteobacteria bacterium SO-S41]|nr:hypothetical protein sos41_17940 [Alphaproteobacteria bacterium SO-S41]
MSISDRLPGMSLTELTRLHANAVRLAEGAPGKQRDQAAELLPALEGEIAARREGKRKTVAKVPKAEGAPKAPREAKPRAPKVPKPPKTESQKADEFLAGVNEALKR